ncbi:glycosyl transferase [Planctomycetales bacterium]|nr:glycosyl transferase [Planctomycetales bacterium]GHT35368.1 glycosyl transferase [Planctomycetales bacterium]
MAVQEQTEYQKPFKITNPFLFRIQYIFWKMLLHIDFFTEKEIKRVSTEFPRVISCNETADKLIAGCSIARYGDGEFAVALGRKPPWAGSRFEQLKRRLVDVLHSPAEEKLVIGISPFKPQRNRQHLSFCKKLKRLFLKNILRYSRSDLEKAGLFGTTFNYSEIFYSRHWRFLRQHLIHEEYGNAFITRNGFAEVPLEKYRKIWENRNAVFIVPQNGRFVCDERLFNNLKSAEYIYVDPMDAFADYDNTLKNAVNCTADNPLFLIAAGMTATVLAFDLYKAGFQAIDLGHLPNCYRQFLGEALSPEGTPMVQKLT